MEFKFKKIGISHVIDFKDLGDDYIMVGRNKIQAISIKVRIEGAKIIVRFQSNFRVENTLEHPLEYSIFRDIDGINIDPHGDIVKSRRKGRVKSRNSSLSRTQPSSTLRSNQIMSDTEDDGPENALSMTRIPDS